MRVLREWWVAYDGSGHVDVLPIDDLVAHEESDDCVCGPKQALLDGAPWDVWMRTHRPLDGRELTEPDAPGR